MMPNISVGKDIQGKYRHNFRPTNSTTSPFGFIQPIFAKFCVGDSTNKFNIRSGVRLAPMPCPTFGRVQLRTYVQYVPYASLLRHYENFREGTRYSTKSSSYIPEELPNISGHTLFRILASYCYFSVYKVTNNSGYLTFTLQENTSGINNLLKAFGRTPTEQIASNPITIDSADFITEVTQESTSTTYTIALRLTQAGKNLAYIFNGLGFDPCNGDTNNYNFLDVIAFYKAYFDIFDPQRTKTWTDTYAFQLLDYFTENNYTTISDSVTTFNTLFNNFISNELIHTYYVDNPDFFSSHIETTAVSSANTVGYVTPTGANSSVSNTANQQPLASNPSYIDQTKITLLKALQKVVNKNTVIGQKLQNLLAIHEGVDYFADLDSNNIGSCAVDCYISDVMSTAETENAYLGEYAGKGIGSNLDTDGDWFTFSARYDGLFLVMQTVVPISDYIQAVRPELNYITRLRLPYKQFDAIGYEVTPQTALHTEILPTFGLDLYTPNSSLGFIPRYSAFKTVFSSLGGEFRLRSVKDSYLPYTLDKLISTRQLINNGNGYKYVPGPGNIVGSPELRYIGNYEHLQNFNRIFYNNPGGNSYPSLDLNTRQDDNFIIHNVFQFQMINGFLPLSDSFDTDGNENGLDITHS